MKHAIRLLALTIILSAGLQAQTLNGRFVTSAYGWERQLQNGTSSSQLRAYENVQLNFGTPDISFHTYLQGSTDFENEAANDPQFRLFNAYLRVKNIADMIASAMAGSMELRSKRVLLTVSKSWPMRADSHVRHRTSSTIFTITSRTTGRSVDRSCFTSSRIRKSVSAT